MDKISAFMDGEAAPAETQQALQRLHNDEECRRLWNCFHLVGDVMRGDPVLREDFVERLRQRMSEEPTVLAPRARWRSTNNFAYSAVAAAAGIAVVFALIMTNNPIRTQSEIAAATKAEQTRIAQSEPAETRAPRGAMANPSQVNEYLVAHQEFSPRTALQGVVPYVRSVSESHDGNRR